MLFSIRPNLALRGRYTLITGASSGIGRETARVVARDHGGHLVLVARRKQRLDDLAAELREAHGVDVVCIEADLARAADVARVVEVATDGRTIAAAVLNAGVSYLGPAVGHPFEDFERMLATNVTSTVYLTQRLVRHMIDTRTEGALLIVSSLAGVSPATWLACYSGTKAFLVNFGLAVGEEVRAHGISVTVFAPGGVSTEMGEKSGTGRRFSRGHAAMMEADDCARDAVAALVGRWGFRIPGRLNQIGALLLRFVPRTVAAGISSRIYRSALLPEAQ